MSYLLDTCVISELISRQPDISVVRWVDKTNERSLYLSVVTLGEVSRGIARLQTPDRKRQLQEWPETDLLDRFADRILPLDAAIMLTWGERVAQLESRGRTLPLMDSLFVATAYAHTLTVVTRNVRDFADTGVDLLNPWETGPDE
jgi:predicted nucleic acid-binding protein